MKVPHPRKHPVAMAQNALEAALGVATEGVTQEVPLGLTPEKPGGVSKQSTRMGRI